MGSVSRVSIPNSIRKTIQNIREIARNHSDEEIYAMLKECSMDPNETAQKLLLQDTFHEVRRKRDKRKENVNTRDAVDSRRRPSVQGRGSRLGRGNHSSSYSSNDAGDGRIVNVRKENGVNQSKEKSAVSSSVPTFDEAKSKGGTHTSRSLAVIANDPDNISHKNFSHRPASRLPADSDSSSPDKILAVCANESGISSASSDPLPVQSSDTLATSAARIIQGEVGSQWTAIESGPAEVDKCVASQDFANHSELEKVVSGNMTSCELPLSTSEEVAVETGNSFMQGKKLKDYQGVEKSLESLSLRPLTTQSDISSRPSSNYGSQLQQLVGSQKVVGLSKEWKSPSIITNHVLPSGTPGTSEIGAPTTDEGSALSEATSIVCTSNEAPIKLHNTLEELHHSDTQHVIIPNHIHVPEAEKIGLSFGSFDASFGVYTCYAEDPDGGKNSTGLSESSQGIEEIDEEPSLSNQKANTPVQEGRYPDHPEMENLLPVEAEGSSNEVFENDQSNQNSVFPPEGPQYSVIHTAPNYSSFGLIPPVLGTQVAPSDSELEASDVSQLSSFVVQQPFDPSASYYNQFYRPGADVDGRFSPFLVPGAANKNNGNTAMLSTQPGQSHEGGNSQALSIAGPPALVSQNAGVMQSTVPVNQQPVPIFRQPAGVISHYPPNYIPYNHYYSPFLLPPPNIHHFYSNSTFPQQPLGGNLYLSPPATAATGVKFSLPQYKSGTNAGNSSPGMPTSFLPYSSFPSGYNTKTTVVTGNPTGNEELSKSQYKENSYVNGQQGEGSAVWPPASSRDVSGVQASSFYNLPPHGQHVTFGPTQAGQSAIAGMYHPASPVVAATVHPLLQQTQTIATALEMVGPPPSTYQQPHHTQINWTNNY